MRYSRPIVLCTAVCLTVVAVLHQTFCTGQQTPAANPDYAQTSLDQAEACITNKEYSKAERILLRFAESRDSDKKRQALYGLGRVYYYLHDYGKAKENLTSALALGEDFDFSRESELTRTMAGIHVYLAYVYMQSGHYQEAIVLLSTAESKGLATVNRSSFLGSNIYSLIAKNHQNSGNLKAAKEYFAKSNALQITDASAASRIKQISLLGLANCNMMMGDHAAAVAAFKEAIERNKENNDFKIAAYVGLSNAYVFKGDYEKAYQECVDTMEALPGGLSKIESVYISGVIQLKMGKIQEAEEYFKRIFLEIKKHSASTIKGNYSFNWELWEALAHYNLGLLALKGKRLEDAFKDMNTAAGILDKIKSPAYKRSAPKYIRIACRYGMSEVLKAQGKKDPAAKELEFAIRMIRNLTPREQEMIGGKRFSMYIEGPAIKEMLKEAAGKI